MVPLVSAGIGNRTFRRVRGEQRTVAFPQQKDPCNGTLQQGHQNHERAVHQLQDIYYAEKQLVKALPKMAKKSTDKQLKQGF